MFGQLILQLVMYRKHYSGMDSEYCDRIGELMDRAEAWCLDIKEIYNKAEVHSINTSKGDAYVGIFSDNSQ